MIAPVSASVTTWAPSHGVLLNLCQLEWSTGAKLTLLLGVYV